MGGKNPLNSEDLGIVLSRISEYNFKTLQFEQCTARLEQIELFIYIQDISSCILNIKQEIKCISKCLITILKQMSHLVWSLLMSGCGSFLKNSLLGDFMNVLLLLDQVRQNSIFVCWKCVIFSSQNQTQTMKIMPSDSSS